MIRYMLRRSIIGIILLFIYVSILFFIIQLALPGDYVSQFAMGLSNADSQNARESLGLDKPIFERYLVWVTKLLHGDLGLAYSTWEQGMPVRDYIIQLLPGSILVFGIGTVLAFSIGLYLGKVSAWRKGGLLPGMITVSGIAFYTSFPPWLAFLIIYFVASRLGLPTFGIARSFRIREPAFRQYEILWLMLLSLSLIIAAVILINLILRRFDKKTIPGLMIFFLVTFSWLGSWYLMDIQLYAWEISKGAILPIITYTLLTFGEVMLLMRTSMAETVHEDYIWTARAKGLKESTVRDRHAARNALLPVMSRMLVSIPYFLTGLVMIERVFDWAGVGTTLFYAVGMQNITLALGMLIVIGVLSMVVRLVLDVLQFYLNPRIREKNIYI